MADPLGPRVVELQVEDGEAAAAGDPPRAGPGRGGAGRSRRRARVRRGVGGVGGVGKNVRVEGAGRGRARVWALRAKVRLDLDGLEHRGDGFHALATDLVIAQVQDSQRGVERPLRLDLDVGEEVVVALRGESSGESLGAARADHGAAQVQLSQLRVEQPPTARAAAAQLRERGPPGQERLGDVAGARIPESGARQVEHLQVGREHPHARAGVLPRRDDSGDRPAALFVEMHVGEVQGGEAMGKRPPAVGVWTGRERGADGERSLLVHAAILVGVEVRERGVEFPVTA